MSRYELRSYDTQNRPPSRPDSTNPNRPPSRSGDSTQQSQDLTTTDLTATDKRARLFKRNLTPVAPDSSQRQPQQMEQPSPRRLPEGPQRTRQEEERLRMGLWMGEWDEKAQQEEERMRQRALLEQQLLLEQENRLAQQVTEAPQMYNNAQWRVELWLLDQHREHRTQDQRLQGAAQQLQDAAEQLRQVALQMHNESSL